jgi:hypothetical protein
MLGAGRRRGSAWRVGAAALSAAAAMLPAGLAHGQAYVSRALIVGGDPAVGTPPQYRYFGLFNPNFDLIINSDNRALAHVPLIDPTVPVGELALYTATSPGDVSLVVRSGAELPGLPGVFPKGYGIFGINSSGGMAISLDLQGPGTTTADNLGLIVGTGANDLEMVARKGGPVPDAPANINFRSVLFPTLTDSGLLTFGAVLGGSGTNAANDSGIYFRRPGGRTLERLVREGDPTPDVPGQSFGASQLVRTNNAGQMLLNSSLAGAGIVANVNDRALWFGQGVDSPLLRVLQTGEPAPGVAPGITFSGASSITLAQDGRIAFRATLSSPIAGQVTTANDSAIYAGKPTEPVLVAREGDAAPVTGAPDAKFSGNPSFHFASGGNIVITSELTGTSFNSDSAVFAGTLATGLHTIAIAGQRAPGTPAGTLFRNPSGSSPGFERAATNGKGQVAFLAQTGTNTITLQDALYLYDPEQGLILVAREGGSIEIRPGEFRTISGVNLGQPGSGQDTQNGPFNDKGVVVFETTFTDGGQGIFTAAVPLAGDADLDKVVSFADFQALERGFGTASEATRAIGDLNGDMAVDFSDFQLLYAHFGEQAGGPTLAMSPGERAALEAFAASHVPEPGWGLWSGAVLFLGKRHRKSGLSCPR